MLIRSAAVILAIFIASASSTCESDRNVQFQNPLYLLFDNGFFYIQGLSNGEAVVMYKHPDDARVFGQYTFKDERCFYETVYYYVQNGKYEFTNPYISDETSFNVTNKLNFVTNGNGYEIEYSISSNGVGIFHNLGQNAERKILPEAVFKKSPAPFRPVREIFPSFANIGKQNLKVSYLKNGENFVQFIINRNQFASIEGSYTLRTSDRRYHTVVYEIPLNDFDYVGMSVREYEVATEENFFRAGVVTLNVNNAPMDVKFFVDKNGFHVNDLRKPGTPVPNQKPQQGVQRPFGQLPLDPRVINRPPVSQQPAQQLQAPIQNNKQQVPSPTAKRV
ncbi:uncharacterized protein [Chironomus tepperi]|uniref:uncharacterized protein n=1 Tax=Chironomus tepperi TaxID=113505 RepID=UPI00391F15A3